jgi:phosphoribosyl-ATP pyrophosphohydrolase/phosphoribosyl-AMP cyclohydrolase
MIGPMTFNRDGLIAAVAQDSRTGRVLMLAWMNAEALALTVETGWAHYFSRSRQALWKKGETSGHLQRVVDLRVDCDRDAVLLRVEQAGGIACHTGRPSCFFGDVAGQARPPGELAADPEGVLGRLGEILQARRAADPASSWTARLLHAGVAAINAKIIEEAGELAAALVDEPDAAVVHEAADLIYHALVGLTARGLTFEDVAAELAGRFATSGVAEKASRGGG